MYKYLHIRLLAFHSLYLLLFLAISIMLIPPCYSHTNCFSGESHEYSKPLNFNKSIKNSQSYIKNLSYINKYSLELQSCPTYCLASFTLLKKIKFNSGFNTLTSKFNPPALDYALIRPFNIPHPPQLFS